eukprot:g7454.t1
MGFLGLPRLGGCLLISLGLVAWQVHRAELEKRPKSGSEEPHEDPTQLRQDDRDAHFVQRHARLRSDRAPTPLVTTAVPVTVAPVAAPVRVGASWIPNHLAKTSSLEVWRPPDYAALPAMPPEVWYASRAEMETDQRYPLVDSALLRLKAQRAVRLEIYGGSMTFGTDCCGKACDMQLRRLAAAAVGDSNMGSGSLEEFIRICHLFLPDSFIVLLYNRDMADEFHTVKDDHDLKILQAVAKHYHLPLLNYEKAMVQFGVFSNQTSLSLMWPRPSPVSYPDWANRHPQWPGHAFYADMLVDWLNNALATLPVTPGAMAPPAPALRAPESSADQDWIKPLKSMNLEAVELCIFPLTTHLARNPTGDTPLQSAGGSWNEELLFNVTFSRKPKLAVQYLMLGRFPAPGSPHRWTSKQLEGQGSRRTVWRLLGYWPNKISITVGAAFTAVEPVDDFTEATVVVRLLDPWTKERSEVFPWSWALLEVVRRSGLVGDNAPQVGGRNGRAADAVVDQRYTLTVALRNHPQTFAPVFGPLLYLRVVAI